MSTEPTHELMFNSLVPHLAENQPDLLTMLELGTEYKECLRLITNKLDADMPKDWLDVQKIIRLVNKRKKAVL